VPDPLKASFLRDASEKIHPRGYPIDFLAYFYDIVNGELSREEEAFDREKQRRSKPRLSGSKFR
jgi:hypothetical protein